MSNIDIPTIAFEIVSLAGDARSILLKAMVNLKQLPSASINDRAAIIKQAQADFKEAEQLINDCHVKQTELLHTEAQGVKHQPTLLMIHAQDHLMTTILLREMFDGFLDIYQQLAERK